MTSLNRKYGFEHPFLPDLLSKKALRFLGSGIPKKVLDLGCGEGADSAFFAQQGFIVTAIDKNQEHLSRLRKYQKNEGVEGLSILRRDAVTYHYPSNRFDLIVCLLVVCCMKRSAFDHVIDALKQSVRAGGIIVMSARNYLDPEFKTYRRSEKMVEKNTFRDKDDCCRYLYFVEKHRLRTAFKEFDILYQREGYAPCKYNEHPRHGDSYIICRRRT
jgi:SAM-dependent methyltransferase